MKFSALGLVLLASLLSTESISPIAGVEARPTGKSRRSEGMITLPLKRIHDTRRSDIHPHLLYQQHVNRGLRRLARMTRRDVPTDDQLRANLERRMFIPPKKIPVAASSADKRMYIPPKKAPAKTARQHVRDFLSDLFGQGQNLAGTGGHRHHGGNGGGNTGATGTGNGNGTTSTTNTTTGGTADTSAGFSEIDLQAEEDNTLTPSDVTTSNGTVGLDIIANDVGYAATVQIGTPATDFKVIMDTGSADFWVTATQCTIQDSTQACNPKLQTLGTASSSSFKDTGKAFSVTYGSGFVSGDIVNDDVVLAGLSLPGHTFGVANVESSDFGGSTSLTDGLMGLAQQGLSQQGVPTPIESLASAGTISSAITSFKISRLADQLNDGEVTIGGLDDSKFDSSTLVAVKNVNTEGFWEADVDSFTVNGKDAGLSGRTAILDTGTTLIIAPGTDADTIHALIDGAKSDGQGGFTIPCTSTASVALEMGGTSFAIDARDLAFSPVDPNDLTGDCISGISSGNVGGATEWLVGDVFLKNVYMSVNQDTNQISLAKLV